MPFSGKLINSGNNAKTVKGDGSKYETAIMYLAPADMVKGINVCPLAVMAGCKAGCLNTAGRGAFNNVQKARARKTAFYRDDRSTFLRTLAADIQKFSDYCFRHGVKPVVRLNGTSDIQWEVGHAVHGYASIFEQFPNVQFYDYTKVYKRMRRKLPANYYLTLSYSKANEEYARACFDTARDTGCSLTVVYRDKARKAMAIANGFNTIDGDKDDLRFLDPQGAVVALYAKGKARKDQSGFVID